MASAPLKDNNKSPFLSIKNLSKAFDQKNALDNLSLDVYKHEIIGIIGHSGSGKSTLLKLIYGLDDVDTGEIRLENVRVKGRSEILVPGDDRIKYVRQNYDLFPDHTVYENIEHQIRFYDESYVKERINKLLDAFNISDIQNIKAKQISGGEQQRVAICCALADSPKLLMLDEPLAHLDQINAKIIKDYLWKFVKSERITTLFVTHNPMDALAYSTRLVIIDNGHVIESGTAQKLYHQPNSLYTANLLGGCFKISQKLIPEEQRKNKRGSYYFRPESISISNTGDHKVVVISSIFYGDRQLVKAKLKNNKIEFYVKNEINISQGDSLNISIDYNQLIFIKN